MTFIEKLNMLLESNGLNRAAFSRLSGIPYTTVDGFYKKGTDNIKMSTLEKIAACFDCTMDYLILDRITDPHGTNSDPTPVGTNEKRPATMRDADMVYRAIVEAGILDPNKPLTAETEEQLRERLRHIRPLVDQ